MTHTQGVGSLDGKTLIDMNNLAVGYFPTEEPEIGVYPPPVPEQPQVVEQHLPMTLGQDSKTNS